MTINEPTLKKPQSNWCLFRLWWTLSYYWIICFFTYFLAKGEWTIVDQAEIFLIVLLIATFFFIFISVIVAAVKSQVQKKKEMTYLKMLEINNENIKDKGEITDFIEHYDTWEYSTLDWYYIIVNNWKKHYRRLIIDYNAEKQWCDLKKYKDMIKLWIEYTSDKDLLKKRAHEKLSEVNNELNNWANLLKRRKLKNKLNLINDIIENADKYSERPAIKALWETYTIWDEATIIIDPTDWKNYEIRFNESDDSFAKIWENPEVVEKITEDYEKDVNESVFHEVWKTVYNVIKYIIIVCLILVIMSTVWDRLDSLWKFIMKLF